MRPLERFQGGPNASFTRKLNALVDRVNGLGDVKGSGIVQSNQAAGAQRTAGISIPQLLPRMPTAPSGICKIDSNDGGGDYTVTRVTWNAGTTTYDADTAGRFYQMSARDFLNYDWAVADTHVPYWQQRTSAGVAETLIDTAAGLGTHTTPKALYSTFEGLEAAQTDTWDIANQGANDGVTFPWTTRVVYGSGGDRKIYGYYRTVTISSAGHIMTISGETRYEIDTPEVC